MVNTNEKVVVIVGRGFGKTSRMEFEKEQLELSRERIAQRALEQLEYMRLNPLPLPPIEHIEVKQTVKESNKQFYKGIAK